MATDWAVGEVNSKRIRLDSRLATIILFSTWLTAADSDAVKDCLENAEAVSPARNAASV
jgi:hypothetical protein